MAKNMIRVHHTEKDLVIADLEDNEWQKATETEVQTYWSGKVAPAGRHFRTRMLWSDTTLYVRFEAAQSEPLIGDRDPHIDSKTVGLWDRDVCEIFIAPDNAKRNKYYEFEIAPTGEWIDLGIEVTAKGRKTDWEYRSEMTSASRIENDKIVMAIKIPFAALGKTPKPGDIWLGNLFRCVGKDPTRGYLSWRPTKTKEPSFHVPSKFGEFEFVK